MYPKKVTETLQKSKETILPLHPSPFAPSLLLLLLSRQYHILCLHSTMPRLMIEGTGRGGGKRGESRVVLSTIPWPFELITQRARIIHIISVDPELNGESDISCVPAAVSGLDGERGPRRKTHSEHMLLYSKHTNGDDRDGSLSSGSRRSGCNPSSRKQVSSRVTGGRPLRMGLTGRLTADHDPEHGQAVQGN